ncbi:hypothetical protein HKX48_006521 [Thoreauomyces humboldtii]|nr:hypothetical protein HKX48_006521 [Thoreauomyces humboldtii]
MSRPKRNRATVNYTEVQSLDTQVFREEEPKPPKRSRKKPTSDDTEGPDSDTQTASKKRTKTANDIDDLATGSAPEARSERKARLSVQERMEQENVRMAMELSLKDTSSSKPPQGPCAVSTITPPVTEVSAVPTRAGTRVTIELGSARDTANAKVKPKANDQCSSEPASSSVSSSSDTPVSSASNEPIKATRRPSRGGFSATFSPNLINLPAVSTLSAPTPAYHPPTHSAPAPSSSTLKTPTALSYVNALPLRLGQSKRAKLKPLLKCLPR